MMALAVCLTLTATAQFKKIENADKTKYILTDSVTVWNGLDQNTKILFEVMVPKEVWDAQLTALNMNDTSLLTKVAINISTKAQYTLKNKESYEPLNGNLATWSETSKQYICNFLMKGRNGYGNLVETKSLVAYKL